MNPIAPASPTPAASPAQTVESFSLRLEGFGAILSAEDPIVWVETQLLNQLEAPVRLLRWAIVKVEPGETGAIYWCEGAYLKNCQ